MKPVKCISIEEARDLQRTWMETRGKAIERGQGFQDTCEFWYSLDELQEYLDYVREKSEEQGVENPGLRIFLGAYKSSGDKNSYSTIFLAPTRENRILGSGEQPEQENNYEIEPLNETHGGWPPKTY